MADKIVILSDGKVEQVGTPQEIYHQPANLFVATFMGSPAMNILTATLDEQVLAFDETTRLDTDFVLDEARQRAPLKVGIRPECIHINHDMPITAEPYVKIQVTIVEDLGAQRVVHATIGKQPILVVTDKNDIDEGSYVYAVLPLRHLYLFSPESELNISQHADMVTSNP